jgi:hypothetical protein
MIRRWMPIVLPGSDQVAAMQLSMDLPVAFPKEAYEYGRRSSGETHGVVLTKPHVVELILGGL